MAHFQVFAFHDTAAFPAMKKLPIALFGLLAILVCLDGCARVEKEKKTQGLEAATLAYGKSIRWAYYETAWGYLHPDLRRNRNPPENLDNIRVTSYEVVQPPIVTDSNQTRAEQVVQIEYVLRNEQVVNRISDRQDWRYDAETKTWWLHSKLPDFK
jgi:hypothetical protein